MRAGRPDLNTAVEEMSRMMHASGLRHIRTAGYMLEMELEAAVLRALIGVMNQAWPWQLRGRESLIRHLSGQLLWMERCVGEGRVGAGRGRF